MLKIRFSSIFSKKRLPILLQHDTMTILKVVILENGNIPQYAKQEINKEAKRRLDKKYSQLDEDLESKTRDFT